MTGVSERINEVLGSHCSGGYGGGTVGQANWQYLYENYQGVEWLNFGAIYRLGDTVRFCAPVNDSRKFGEFLDDLSRLEDYPILDDDVYNSLIMELEDQEWEELVREHNLDWDYVHKVRNEGDYYFDDSDGYGTLYGLHPMFDMEEFVTKVRYEQQTWLVHYYSKMTHHVDVCEYCKESVEVVA
jgi:hypothetical protein